MSQTKKRFSKGIACVLLIVALLAMSSVQVFAATKARSIQVYQRYAITAKGTGRAITYYNNNSTLWTMNSFSGATNQKWTPGRNGSWVWLYYSASIGTGTSYVMAVNRYGPMELYATKESGASATTSCIDFHTINSSNGEYRLYVPNLGMYLYGSGAYGYPINAAYYNQSAVSHRWIVYKA